MQRKINLKSIECKGTPSKAKILSISIIKKCNVYTCQDCQTEIKHQHKVVEHNKKYSVEKNHSFVILVKRNSMAKISWNNCIVTTFEMTGPFKKALRKFWVIANQVNMENDHNSPVTLQISHQDQGVQNIEAFSHYNEDTLYFNNDFYDNN